MCIRRWLPGGIVAGVVGVFGILYVLHEDSTVNADVLIDRPPADVWKVISDSAAYSDWNPFITRVDGDFREGATIRIVLGAGTDSMVFKPTVLVVRPEKDLCWRGSVWVRGVFDGTHCIRLTALANGTHLEQTETFSGLLAGRLTKDVIQETRREFQAMNTAVKRRAEANPS
ncbi:hypothetical protein LMG22931_07088 [Paraburkholderia nemoris]|nr:hypothetical protein LMG22931_07088 [Paraburkholderia nemoris]